MRIFNLKNAKSLKKKTFATVEKLKHVIRNELHLSDNKDILCNRSPFQTYGSLWTLCSHLQNKRLLPAAHSQAADHRHRPAAHEGNTHTNKHIFRVMW